MAELKRCAHCGGIATKFRCDAAGHYYTRDSYSTHIWGRPLTHKFIMCEKCGMRTKVYATDKGAFNAWNRRVNNGVS